MSKLHEPLSLPSHCPGTPRCDARPGAADASQEERWVDFEFLWYVPN